MESHWIIMEVVNYIVDEFWWENARVVYCTGRGIPTDFGRVFRPGTGTGMDSCTRELQNEPWIIQNG